MGGWRRRAAHVRRYAVGGPHPSPPGAAIGIGGEPAIQSGYISVWARAMCYGSTPLMARQAFLHAPDISTAAGGCLAYTAATLFFLLILLKPGSWTDIKSMKRENLPCRSRIAARCASRAVRSDGVPFRPR
jgi:hypothetical protein